MKSGTVAVLVVALALAVPAVAAAPDAALYKAKCAMCHGPDGGGQTPTGKSMKVRDLRSDEVQKQTDVELTKVISGGKGKMPPYGKQLSTAQTDARLPGKLARPGVGGEGLPLGGVCLVVGVEAGADRAVALADVEESPDLPATRQPVPATFRSHVVGLPDH